MDTRLLRILASAVLVEACPVLSQDSGWPAYGNDPGGTRYSAAAKITKRNVSSLKQVWTYRTGAIDRAGRLKAKIAFEATPILADGTVYLSTPLNRIIALDPETGREKWVYDPNVDVKRDYSEVTSRGVAYWAGRGFKGPCARRVLEGTIDARLLAVDANTGKPCSAFGVDGEVDLTQGMDVRGRGDYQLTSPPAVVGDVVVVGSAIGDNRAARLEKGTVRAYDVQTGKLRWAWDPLEGAEGARGGNAWGVLSADPALGMVFVPTGSASPDFYGGLRPGDNRFANSVTALNATTGKFVWSFQVVHHDLWDYDVASQPVLISFSLRGKTMPAVVVTTKIGHVFVLDRRTGKPLSPVEERPVPLSDVPGEVASKTQPFPVAIEPIAPSGFAIDDAWGANEADRNWCREQVRGLRSEGLFTPPSVRGTLVYPGNVGGVAWGGPAFDPVRGWLVVNTNRLATVVRLIPREKAEARRSDTGENRLSYEFGRQEGTPYAMERAPLITRNRFLCNAPPWGALAALNLRTGRKAWEVPLGTFQGQAGSPSMGGPVVTAGGLVFIAATMDERLRAFDTETGAKLWEAELPASAHATPMTYIWKGKQYVVICAGGHAKLGTKLGDSVIAFGL